MKTPSPNIITLGARAAAYKMGEGHKQPVKDRRVLQGQGGRDSCLAWNVLEQRPGDKAVDATQP